MAEGLQVDQARGSSALPHDLGETSVLPQCDREEGIHAKR